MIETILPATVMAAESIGLLDETAEAAYPEEAALVSTATARRRAEFAAARACGRTALARLGVPPGPIPRAPGGGPRWPIGVLGSITHCAGYRAAVTGRVGVVRAIGIDAEPHRPLRAGLLDVIASPAERAHLAALRVAEPAVCWDRLLFSAKESVYKAWFPRTGRWLDFADAAIAFTPGTDRFNARTRVPAPPDLARLSGRWLVGDGIAVTAIAQTG
ncbi:MAG TPA: 4'-phosphopantetheinyl transferase superfamily protein [Pseudonocardiaceae bacterium]|jgi:4'-phosphopantetheinyl transferase EntD|nr:4'-phosphopantetheinyl transferase superfamily protein [Pseudonocardiaceae bacterium]